MRFARKSLDATSQIITTVIWTDRCKHSQVLASRLLPFYGYQTRLPVENRRVQLRLATESSCLGKSYGGRWQVSICVPSLQIDTVNGLIVPWKRLENG